MAPRELTDYELRRLENIKRNNQMLASLKILSKVNDLSASTKLQRAQTKSYKATPEKKSKIESPIVIRQSLRARGMPPDASTASGLKDDYHETLRQTPKSIPNWIPSADKPIPIFMRDTYCGVASDKKFTETMVGVLKKTQFCCSDGSAEGIERGSCYSTMGLNERDNLGYPIRFSGSIDLKTPRLEPENIARVVPDRATVVKFFPSMDLRMIAVGNNLGNVGFWDVDAKGEDGDGIYLYHPHRGPVSGMAIQPFSISKVYTSCNDGYIRLMDVEKEVFDFVYSSNYSIFSVSQRPNDVRCLYFSEGHGVLNIWEERAGKALTSWLLHEDKINTIDFCSENTNIMVTSSTDGTACIWDLRNIDANKPRSLKTVRHKRTVHSAYFSPSGSCLATTSLDNKIGLLAGANFEATSMIYHYNQNTRSFSPFRAIWGWDDSYLFIGNMKRGIDIISIAKIRKVATLQSPHLSAVSSHLHAHPYKIGMLAGATSGGKVYMWTTTF